MNTHNRISVYYLISSLRRCGAATVLYNTIKNLGPEIHPIVITMSQEGPDSMCKDFSALQKCTILCINEGRGLSIIRTIFYIIKLFKNNKNAIVHSHGLRPDIISAIVAILGYKSISTIHSNFFLDYQYKYGKIFGKILSFVHFYFLGRVSLPIGVSESLTKTFLERGLSGAVTVRNGIDISIYKCEAQSSKRKNFIAYGRIVNLKRFDLIVQAFVESKMKGVELHIFGEGPAMPDIEKYANDQVKFYGNVRNIHTRLHAYQCFISASETEAMPNAVLEALCSGMSLILSDIPPHREIASLVPSKTDVYFFKPGNFEELSTMIESEFGRHTSDMPIDTKIFSAETMAHKYESIYKKL